MTIKNIRHRKIKEAAALLVLGMFSISANARTYTLSDVIAIATRHSRELQLVEEEIIRSDADILAVRAAAFPRIVLDAAWRYSVPDQSYTRIFDTSLTKSDYSVEDEVRFLQQIQTTSNPFYQADTVNILVATAVDALVAELSDIFSGGLYDYELLWPQRASFELSLHQPLFAQGKILTGVRIARARQSGLFCLYENVRETVVAQTIKFFYRALSAMRREEVRRDAVRLAQESHTLTLTRLSVGEGTELDTLTSRLHWENAKVALRTAQGESRIALNQLARETGIVDSIHTINLAGDFPFDTYDISLPRALELARTYNKRITRMRAQETVQKEKLRYARSDFLPRVYCGGSLESGLRFGGKRDILPYNEQSLFIGLSMEIFSGMERTSSVKRAVSDMRSFNVARFQLQETIELQTRQAWEALSSARAAVAQTQFVLDLAKKSYDMSLDAYRLGSMSLLDFQKREQAVNEAKEQHNSALYEYQAALVDLKLVMGVIFGETNE